MLIDTSRLHKNEQEQLLQLLNKCGGLTIMTYRQFINITPLQSPIPTNSVFFEDDIVRKLRPKGTEFPYSGPIRAVFNNSLGETRLVIESDVQSPMLMLFNPNHVILEESWVNKYQEDDKDR